MPGKDNFEIIILIPLIIIATTTTATSKSLPSRTLNSVKVFEPFYVA